MGNRQPGAGAISNCCFCSSADNSPDPASVRYRARCQTRRVSVAAATETTESVVTSPTAPRFSVSSRQPAPTLRPVLCRLFRYGDDMRRQPTCANGQDPFAIPIFPARRPASAVIAQQQAVARLSTMMVPFALRSRPLSPASRHRRIAG
ncbi:hypothetical protein KCP70_09035 [Salmonella enterica subsp. enterica]|nr:hypothetical protein KCP70_09035 [Salmonella enterica subsp. enterica]